jgi:flagellar basal body-associated protein FliL
MKKSDIAMIILIASVSMLAAYFAANSILGDTKNQSVKVKTAEPISATVEEPDPTVFNPNAINPTVEVIIGGDGATPQS